MSNYKENISWLNELPPNWSVAPIRSVIKQVNEKRQPNLQLLSVYRDYGVILKDSRDDNHNKPGEDLNNYKVVKPGQLVINKMKTWQGSLGVSDYLGIVSPAYLVCELKGEINKRYLHYLLRSHPYIFEYNRISYGVRVDQWDLKWEYFKKLPLLIPPRKEQDAIVKFLEERLTDIAQYISIKQKQIELLNEQKAAIINQAVTKGLDPNAKMKNSGVEWLGDVPEDWETIKLKFISQVIFSNVDKLSFEDESDVLLCNYVNVYKNDFIISEMDFMKATATKSEIENFILKKNDLVVTKDSETYEDIANPALVADDLQNVICGYHLAIIRVNSESVIPSFLFYLFKSRSFNKQFAVKANGITRYGLSQSSIKDARILIPNLIEQNEIVTSIELNCNYINQQIDKIIKQVELIQNYKNSIISEAVTGKIKVI